MITRSNLRKFMRHARQGGVRHAATIALRYLSGGGGQTPTGMTDRVARLNAVYCDPFGPEATGENSNLMQWVIPSFGFGSGGHMTIFRFINNLAALGHPQRVVILPPHSFNTAEDAQRAIAEWYMPLNATVVLGRESILPCHALIATGHQTAHTVAAYRGATHRLYFVQDYEPYFFPVSSESYMAESTYRLGLIGVTAGDWLAEKLAKDFGMKTHAISFGVNHEIYHPKGRKSEGAQKVILFYARHVTQRRLVELGLAALMRLAQRRSDFKVLFVGGDMSGIDMPFEYELLGEMPEAQLGDVFRRSDLGVVLSGTNLSLMPLELAACQCAVLMNDGPNARWLLTEDEAFFAAADPASLSQEMEHALSDTVARKARVQAALARAQSADWMEQAKSMARFTSGL
ncbi:glycosyltransferase family 4 protein [Celeribacter sp. PS-C1]|uniref:glycosyltransferase family 4 protein n=1 Tax=Celeribacter sp. PS-C1 TaxID=2820813 RepID=UPI001C683C0A|nr:glycosyltransferase family 4 protein [Celeribacter sp. PS-C1]MBW6416188.1 glycosyltransferase family 4 protein [Celeribacter sp. PS-C1]